MHDFGISLELMPDEEESQMLENNVQIALQQGSIDLSDAIDIREVRNIKLANQLLKVKQKQRQARLQEEQQANIQAQAQANAQAQQVAAQAEIQKTTEEGGPRNSTILKNISSLIDTGVLNGKRYYDFTFQGTDDVNTQKYRIEPIPGDSEHVMVTQAHSNGSWKGVEPEKYPVTTLQKELGSSKKSSAKELTLEELKAKYTKQQ